MMKKLYVGNLPYQSTEEDVRELFARYGEVHAVRLVTDRETGRSRGFAFVDMDDAGAGAAEAELDGADYGGRTLRVNEARERRQGPPPRRR